MDLKNVPLYVASIIQNPEWFRSVACAHGHRITPEDVYFLDDKELALAVKRLELHLASMATSEPTVAPRVSHL
jgi:hypothetical protein